MQISEEILEKIKEQNDIVDVISEYVRLKKSGRNYSGLCPFHNEKSPSFSVSQDKQIYKCFGCGEAGNVISFIMKYKNLQFPEAAKYLADRAGIQIEQWSKGKSKISQKKDILYNVNAEAGRHFFRNLMKTKEAKEYFLNRGINETTIRKFGLGYSVDSWNDLIRYLKSKRFNEEIMLEAGLVSVSERKNSKYDRFRNRVMFPVFDYRGKVIGFGGRVLDDSKPKYLNSPETMVFQKGINLYGLNFSIKERRDEDYFIIVEGYMDVISLHQYGITNVVASLGTALTENQARLLKRYTSKVVISYDADLAGQNATARGLEILINAGFEVRVLNIPQGKDPDEFIRSNGKEAFINLIKKAEPFIDYKLRKAEDGINLKDSSDLIKYGNRVVKILSEVNSLEKDIYIRKICERTGIKEQSIYDLLSNKIVKTGINDKMMNNNLKNGEKLYVEPAFVKAERALIKLLLDQKHYNYVIDKVNEDNLITEEHKKIFTIIKEGKKGTINNIETYLESQCNDANIIKELVKVKDLTLVMAEDIEKMIEDYVRQLTNYKIGLQIEELKKKQEKLVAEGKIQESIEIAGKLAQIKNSLKVK